MVLHTKNSRPNSQARNVALNLPVLSQIQSPEILMTSYKGSLTYKESVFNKIHSRERNVIERAFVHLKAEVSDHRAASSGGEH